MPKGIKKKYYGFNASSASHARALQMAQQLRELLNKHGVRAPVIGVEQYNRPGEEYWQAHTPSYVYLPSRLSGYWTFSTYWRYRQVPGDDSAAILTESTMGLNVEGHPLDHCVGSEGLCLIRYDYDIRDAPRAHLNVMQPAPLLDKAHWRLPVSELSDKGWDPEQVLRYLLSEGLQDDLLGARWPPA